MKKILLNSIIYGLLCSLIFSIGIGFSEKSDQSGQYGVAEQFENSEKIGLTAQINQETQNQGEESNIQTQQQFQINNPEIGEQVRTQTQSQVQSGSIVLEGGKQIRLEIQNNNQIQLMSGNTEAKTSMNMFQEQTQTGTKLQVQLSNGKNAEVKVMPDAASERAMERLRIKVCSAENGCSIELKEVGSGEQVRAAYEIKVQKQAKILGIFGTKMQVQAQVDAENGEVIQIMKPWWAFLATESEE